MIRRWSRVNDFNFNALDFFFLEKCYKINIFKTSVNFKKFKFKYSKFKRKSALRIKHGSSFLLYTNVFKLWSKDYLFNKHSSKNQYLLNIFSNNFLIYNFNFIKNKNENPYYALNCVFVAWSKKSYFYCFSAYPHPLFKYFKNNNITFAWFLDDHPCALTNTSIVTTQTQWDSELYAPSQTNFTPKNFDFTELFLLSNLLSFSKIIQYRAILNALMAFSPINL